MRCFVALATVIIGHAAPALCSASFAGPLNPPAGPIASTAKPLSEVEPRIAINATNTPGDGDSVFRITQPGSYYLASALTGVSGKRGIEVASSSVTIDLNGFALIGVPGALSGIEVVSGDGVVVRNGIVRQWPLSGVDLSAHSLADQLVVISCGGSGLRVGFDSLVTNCVLSLNAGVGIEAVGCCATIVGCQVGNNDGSGIVAISSTSVLDCTVTDNGAAGILLGSNGSAKRCSVTFNAGDGITAVARNTISDNLCARNLDAGISAAGVDNLLTGNNCVNNGIGVEVTSVGNFITRNVCSGNSTRNWDVVASNKCLVVLGANAGAISGDAGGVGPGSTDPNANFTY